MTNSSDRVFIIGGTGYSGKRLVTDLLKAGIPMTLLARDPAKVNQLYPDSNIAVVKGSYADLSTFKDALPGHTRLYLLITDVANKAKHARSIAEAAYAAGIKQIVDVSCICSGQSWRGNVVNIAYREAEEAILSIPNRGAYVALRPAGFMTNELRVSAYTIKKSNEILGSYPPDHIEGWVSPTDIGALAAIIFQEPIEKHGDGVYDMVSDFITGEQRAAIYSKVLGREIKYRQISASESYQLHVDLLKMPHLLAYILCHVVRPYRIVPNDLLSILLKRKTETFEEWLISQKENYP